MNATTQESSASNKNKRNVNVLIKPFCRPPPAGPSHLGLAEHRTPSRQRSLALEPGDQGSAVGAVLQGTIEQMRGEDAGDVNPKQKPKL